MRTAEGGLEKKGSYYYIGHFSRCIQPGAVKIGLSSFTDELEATAFSNPDGSIALVVLNRRERELDFSIRLDRENYLKTGIPAHTIRSYLFLPEGGERPRPEANGQEENRGCLS